MGARDPRQCAREAEKAAHEADRAEAEAGIDMVSNSSPTLARGHKPLSLNGDLVTRLTDALPDWPSLVESMNRAGPL